MMCKLRRRKNWAEGEFWNITPMPVIGRINRRMRWNRLMILGHAKIDIRTGGS